MAFHSVSREVTVVIRMASISLSSDLSHLGCPVAPQAKALWVENKGLCGVGKDDEL